MNKIRLYVAVFLTIALVGAILPASFANAAPLASAGDFPSTLAPVQGEKTGGLLNEIFGFLLDKLLGPILNIAGGWSTHSSSPVLITPLPGNKAAGKVQPVYSSLAGKTIVVDPGHGGSNPGAVEWHLREADNNLAIGFMLREKLRQAGAEVIMTRDDDRTVAPEGSSLTRELAARVNMAEASHADLFVSIHTNSNPDQSVTGAMTFYPEGKPADLARKVQNALIKETGAVDKGISTANFYVLRNAATPAILIETGFISNYDEAHLLNSDDYRQRMAQGIFNGISAYCRGA